MYKIRWRSVSFRFYENDQFWEVGQKKIFILEGKEKTDVENRLLPTTTTN